MELGLELLEGTLSEPEASVAVGDEVVVVVVVEPAIKLNEVNCEMEKPLTTPFESEEDVPVGAGGAEYFEAEAKGTVVTAATPRETELLAVVAVAFVELEPAEGGAAMLMSLVMD
jgi:hypothetical protein